MAFTGFFWGFHMRQWIVLLVVAVILTGCQSSKNQAVPQEPGEMVSSEEQLEQLRRIANDEEEAVEDEENLPFNPQEANVANLEALRQSRGAPWEYDPGPDVNTPVGRRFAELFARTPNYRAIGQYLLSQGQNDRSDKFRWQFGPMFYRGRLAQNQVKVLIIGQEGAQDENISDRSFTGGTGGRMQNMLAYLGLDRSYLFLNTFVYTIQGQYADYAPMLIDGRVQWRNLLTPGMLLLAQDPRSPIVAHRHEILDHAIAANADSLKLIIAVGGAAQDSLATYIMSKGGRCLTAVSDPKRIQAVAYGSASAGGNKRFFFPVDRNGRNLLVGPNERPRYDDAAVQTALKSRANSPQILERLVKSNQGPMQNGLVDLRQTTMRLETCQVNGRNNTLYGLGGMNRDIRFIGVQHPGSNSPTLQAKFAGALSQIRSWQSGGWRIEPDRTTNGQTLQQPFERGFRYAHLPVPRRDFRFGLPEVVGLGTTSTTRRESGRALEIGSRDSGRYARVQDAYQPDATYQRTDLPNEPPKSQYHLFDFGPGEGWARVFTENLPQDQLGRLNRTAAAKFGAGAIYRGRPSSAEILVLADQTSHDDMWVGRAMMGFEGQRLQGFLAGLGVGPNYAIIRTLPVDTLGGDPRNIQQLLEASRPWRTSVLSRIVQENRGRLKAILVMGPQAEQEIRTFNSMGVPVISVSGPQGYQNAFQQMQRLPGFAGRRMVFNINPMPIAREDIPYGMRRWTGTAGDRVLRATGDKAGQLYQVHAPDWAVKGPAARPPGFSQQESLMLKNLSR